MKFLYGGKVVRTSKTHHYTHAIINERGNCVMCSSKKEGCEREVQRHINENLYGIENCERAIKAIEAGKKKFLVSWGRQSIYTDILHTVDDYKRSIAGHYENINYFKTHWKIVEIEEIQ